MRKDMEYIPQNSPCIAYRGYNSIRNCGDAINPYIIKAVTGMAPIMPPRGADHVIGIGSIIHLAKERSFIWGTGMLSPIKQPPVTPDSHFRAIRGKLSYRALKAQGKQIGDIPLGDPGILISRIIRNEPVSSKHKVAIIPHHHSITHPFFEKAKSRDDVVVVNMVDDTLKPIEDILTADIVLSESLHGLVFAEALNKPSVWIARRDDEKWAFKFQDWFSTMDRPQVRAVQYPFDIDEVAKHATLHESHIDENALIDCFPKEETTCQNSVDVLDFISCRISGPIRVAYPKDCLGHESLRLGGDVRAMDGDFAKILRRAAGRAIAGRAESHYVLFEDSEVPAEVLDKAIGVLERDTTLSHVNLIPRTMLAQESLPDSQNSAESVLTSPMCGGSMLLRPNLLLKTDKKFATMVFS